MLSTVLLIDVRLDLDDEMTAIDQWNRRDAAMAAEFLRSSDPSSPALLCGGDLHTRTRPMRGTQPGLDRDRDRDRDRDSCPWAR